MFLSTIDYIFFILLTATLMKLCHIKRDHPVHTISTKCPCTVCRNALWHFLSFFPSSWVFLVQILRAYYTFLSTLDYKFIFNYLQNATLTKLCHIKCNHPACVSADGGHFEHMMVVALNMA